MKHIVKLLLCIALLMPCVASAQSSAQPAAGNDEVFRSLEHMPSYPGGLESLMEFLGENLTYPEEAVKNKKDGRVIVQFIVEKDGSVSEAKVVRSVSKELDAEALRVCKLLDGFTPGYVDGRPVRVWYTLPIVFKLPAEESGETPMP